jgi:hypothetical protein
MQVGSRKSSPGDARADVSSELGKFESLTSERMATSTILLAWNVCAHIPGT